MGFEYYRSILERAHVILEPGLNAREVYEIERRYRFRFPPDYCAFLMHTLPVSHRFVDWRHADEGAILNMLSWPYEGICFDIEHNHLWLDAWGPRPAQLSDRFAVAKEALDRAPTLIPITTYRYIPDAPEEVGNPVFSVWQADIVYDGRDLREYLENEFARERSGLRRRKVTEPVKHIAFWSDMEEGSGIVHSVGDSSS